MRKEEFPIYLNHALGIMTLGAWLETYVKDQYQRIEPDNIILSEKGSRYFKIGFPKFKESDLVSLCVTSVEFDWLSKIVFEEAIIDRKNKMLALVAKPIFGDKRAMIDIRQFYIAFTFDNEIKIDMLSKYKNMTLRKYWLDEESKVRFTNGKNLWTIPLKEGSIENIIKDIQYSTYENLINKRIMETNAYNVKYEGNPVDISRLDPELQELLTPFNPENYDRLDQNGNIIKGKKFSRFKDK